MGGGFVTSRADRPAVRWRVALLLIAASLLVAALPGRAAQASTCPSVAPGTGAVSPAPAPWIDWSGCSLVGANFAGVDMNNDVLVGADLSEADFSGANLTNANVAGVVLSNTVLGTANLSSVRSIDLATGDGLITGVPASMPLGWGVVGGLIVGPGLNLRGAKLAGADLTAVSLAGTDLTNAGLVGADLAGTDLVAAILGGVGAQSANFVGANLTGADLTGARLTSATLDGASLSGATLTHATFNQSSLNLADFSGVYIDQTYLGAFTGTIANLPTGWRQIGQAVLGPRVSVGPLDLSGANLTGMDLSHATLQSVDLTNADLSNVSLYSAVFTDVNLTNANLLGADITYLTRTNVTWSNTTCPDGGNSDQDADGCGTPDIHPPGTVKGLTISGSRAGLLLSWSPNHEPDLGGYNVYRSTMPPGHGAWVKINPVLITGLSTLDEDAMPGAKTYYRVVAQDHYGNESAFVQTGGIRPGPGLHQETAGTYRGNWRTVKDRRFCGGSAIRSGTGRSRVGFTFTGRSITVITDAYTSSGSADFFLDGHYVDTVDLGSPSRRISPIPLWSASFGTRDTHHLRIRVIDSAGTNQIYVDAFVVGH